MKVIVLGASSAFSTGDYLNAISTESVSNRLDQALTSLGEGGNPDQVLQALKEDLLQTSEKLYRPLWQSNFIMEFNRRDGGIYRLVLDFGSDFRHSLKGAGYSLSDIDGYYCSHPHADHIGGIEGIALPHIFNPFFREGKADWLKNPKTGEMDQLAHRLSDDEQVPSRFKPDLFGHKSVLNELWAAARPGLETIQGVPDVNLHTYFNVHYMRDNRPLIMPDGDRTWSIFTVSSVHVTAGYRQMPSYGLMLESSDHKVVFMPTDIQFMAPRQLKLFYERADVVYQDCETGPRSDVHPHIDDLKTLPPELKKKCLLYHYATLPEVEPGEFAGILTAGSSHEY